MLVRERTGVVEWAVAARPVAGEERSGDDAIVLTCGPDAVVAAVDGLGHGSAAARAANAAMEAVRTGPRDDVVALAERCHAALEATRGAAIALAAFGGDGTMTWLGVGNITGRLVPAGELSPSAGHWLLSHPGVPGDALPRLRPATLPLRRGDVLVLATDGVDAAFADDLAATGPCEEIADRVLERYGRTDDDALVVAVRYLGGDPA